MPEYMYVYKYVCVCLCVGMYMIVQVPVEFRRSVRSPGTGVTGGYELPNMGSGKWTWILCRLYSQITEPSLQTYIWFLYPMLHVPQYVQLQLICNYLVTDLELWSYQPETLTDSPQLLE